MKNQLILTLGLFSGGVLTANASPQSYIQAQQVLVNLSPERQQLLSQAPDEYRFENRFDGVRSSVSYSGQSFRQVLIADLKQYMSDLTRGGYDGSAEDAYLALDSYYSYDAASTVEVSGAIYGLSEFTLTAKDLRGGDMPAAEGYFYDDLQENGKQLRNKTAGNDNPLRRQELHGWSTMVIDGIDVGDQARDDDGKVKPEDLIDTWLKLCAKYSADSNPFRVDVGGGRTELVTEACLTQFGLDLTQLVEKFLHGAVSFSQAAGDYFSTSLGVNKGLNAGNSTLSAGKAYTALEHHWDEAFGYFGAARDYRAYSLTDIKQGYSRDTNNDGAIALLSEKNFGAAINAVKRQLTAAGNDVDFVSATADALIKGRYVISQGVDDKELISALAITALAEWEKIIAATVVHYINRTINEMEQWGSEDYSFKQHAKYWSEMKGFALAFQFSPVAILSDTDFDRFHQLVGDFPVLATAVPRAKLAYLQNLVAARELLASAYGFSAMTTENW